MALAFNQLVPRSSRGRPTIFQVSFLAPSELRPTQECRKPYAPFIHHRIDKRIHCHFVVLLTQRALLCLFAESVLI